MLEQVANTEKNLLGRKLELWSLEGNQGGPIKNKNMKKAKFIVFEGIDGCGEIDTGGIVG